MVYADWLQGQGDPRGELIALQASGNNAAAEAFLEEHIDYFLGPLKEHRLCYDGLYNNVRSNSDAWKAEARQAFIWKNGFIYRLRLAHNCYHTEWQGKLRDVLGPMLAHPSAKFLVEVHFQENDDPSEDTLDDLIAILANHAPPTVRRLVIGDNVDQISWYRVGNLSKLWEAVPNLTHLEIEAGEFTLGTIELPKLVKAVFKTGGLSTADAKAIANATWPNIEHLEVYYGDPEYGCTATVDDVVQLLERTDLPKLRYLAVKNAEFQNELVEPLAKSPLVKQLKTLDLSEGILTDASVERFLQHKAAFAHLDVLDVTDTYLSKGAVEQLQGIAKTIEAGRLREEDDPEYRFVGTGE
jgi:hypothetical protein